MPYNHSNKIGNKGDLIKHYALTTLIGKLTSIDQFSYVEVHSGRADYKLQSNGEWKQGIGKFSYLFKKLKPENKELHNFFNLDIINNIENDMEYSGSSKIVFNSLISGGIKNINIHLCDTDENVCKELENSYKGIKNISIYCENGYEKVKQLKNIDLLFIDPPDISETGHYYPYLDILKYCISNEINFVSWNPLHGNTVKGIMSKNCQSVVDFANTQNIPIISTRWTDGWSGQMCGCQMLFSMNNGNELVESCRNMSDFMGWNIV